MDNTLNNFSSTLLWIPLFRMTSIGEVLYHELGHHVHYYIRPEYREKEDVADDWSRKFLTNFIRRRYWYAVWPLVLMGKARRWWRKKRDVED